MVLGPGQLQRAPQAVLSPAAPHHDGRARHPDPDDRPLSAADARPDDGPLARLQRLLVDRVIPQLRALGFVDHGPSLVADRGETCWVLDPELAPWSAPDHVAVTMAWGVHVPGLEEALGDVADAHDLGGQLPPRAWDCPLHGRLGQPADGLEAHWFTVRSLPGPAAVTGPVLGLLDARTAVGLVGGVTADLLPRLRRVESLVTLQHALVATLGRRRGAPTDAELRLIRNVAGISLLLGEKTNAARWLDYLAARSAASMAPDVVAARLASLRLRCAG